MALFQKKEKKIYFPDRLPVKKKITWTQESLVTDYFHITEFELDEIMTIDLPRDLAERMKIEGGRLSPELVVYPLNKFLCYREKDESRVYQLLTDLQDRIEKERPAVPEPQKVERKAELGRLVGGANARAAGATAEQKSYLEKMGLAEPAPVELPTDEEKVWAENVAVKELKDPPPPLEEKKPKKRKSMGRTNQIMTRLTDGEMKTFRARVKKSGLAQGEYLREMALSGQVVINERSEIDVAILDELTKFRAELGRQGGMLKMIIKPNEGQRELSPDEWAALIAAVRDMEKARDLVSKLEVKISNGNNQTSVQQKR